MSQTQLEAKHAFSEAEARRKVARTALKAAEQDMLTLESALYFEQLSREDRRQMTDLRERIAVIFPNGLPERRKIQKQLEEQVDVVERLRDEFRSVTDEYEIARRSEAQRIAEALQPEHVQTLREIAAAMEALSELIAREREIRQKYSDQSPERVSCLLPETDLEFARLDRWDSPAARWSRSIAKWIS